MGSPASGSTGVRDSRGTMLVQGSATMMGPSSGLRGTAIHSVLLVEDTRGDAMLARAHLRAAFGPQVEVVVTESSEAASALLASRSFDVVLMDLGLPDASGVDLVGHWANAYPGLAIVVLTGREDEEVAKDALAAGAQDYLLKAELAPGLLARSLRHAVARAGSEYRYRSLFAQSTGIVNIHDLAGRIQSINPAGAQVLGYVPGEMEGMRLHDYVEAEHAWRVDQYLERVRTQGQNSGRLALRHRDGSPRFLDFTNHLYGRGPEAYVVGVAMDVTAQVDLERRLRTALDELRAVTDASPLGLFRTDAQGRVIYINARMQAMVDTADDDARKADWNQAVHPEDRERVSAWWAMIVTLEGARQHELEHRWVRRDGGVVWTRVTVAESRDGGQRTGFVGTLEDITATRLAQRALRRQEAQAQTLADALPMELVLLDGSGAVAWINDTALAACGRPRDAVLGQPLWPLWSSARRDALAPLLSRALQGERLELDFAEAVAGASPRVLHARLLPEQDDEALAPDGVHLIVEDVTEQRRHEQHLRQQAERDPLTGLLNRTGLVQRLEEALATSTSVAVFFMDLDGFKQVNDTHGHAAGDLVLQQCAQRLSKFVRSSDAVARLGGDEFVLLLPGVADADAARIGIELRAALEAPYAGADGVSLLVGASVGVAIGAAPMQADALLASADRQQYGDKRARQQGRARRGLAGALR